MLSPETSIGTKHENKLKYPWNKLPIFSSLINYWLITNYPHYPSTRTTFQTSDIQTENTHFGRIAKFKSVTHRNNPIFKSCQCVRVILVVFYFEPKTDDPTPSPGFRLLVVQNFIFHAFSCSPRNL